MEFTIEEARLDGLEAGRLNLSSGVNPCQPGSAESDAWERSRSTVQAQRIALEHEKRTRNAICRYAAKVECNCGGRGLCLDVA